MNEGDIAERFIRAAEIDRMDERVGPKHLKAQAMPYVHTQADKNGWGGERLAEERKEFWERLGRRVSPREMSEAEETKRWLALVKNSDERAALINWADCMAGDGHFKDWCFARGIHPETGRRRKDRAVLRILLAIGCKPLQHNDFTVSEGLLDHPDLSDIPVNIRDDAPRTFAEISPGAKPMRCDFDTDLSGFDWAETQNQRRRERDAKRRQQAA